MILPSSAHRLGQSLVLLSPMYNGFCTSFPGENTLGLFLSHAGCLVAGGLLFIPVQMWPLLYGATLHNNCSLPSSTGLGSTINLTSALYSPDGTFYSSFCPACCWSLLFLIVILKVMTNDHRAEPTSSCLESSSTKEMVCYS